MSETVVVSRYELICHLESSEKRVAECGIYAIENICFSSVYVGATKGGFLRRWATHRGALRAGRSGNPGLQRDWITYGSGYFKFMVLEVLSPDQAFAPREQYWIDELRRRGYQLYNIQLATERPLNPYIPFTELPKHVLFYKVDEVAQYMRCRTSLIRHLLQSGQLRGVRVGSRWRITPDALRRFTGRG